LKFTHGFGTNFCRSLKALPKEFGNLKHLIYLHLGNCEGLKQLPPSIRKLEMLVTLNLFQCSALKYLPLKLDSLKRLESLNLLGCGRFDPYNDLLGKKALGGLVSLRNLKTDAHNFRLSRKKFSVRSLVIHKSSDSSPDGLESMDGLEDLTLHTGDITVFASQRISSLNHNFVNVQTPFLNLKTLRFSLLPNLQRLVLNNCPNLLNLTLNDCPDLVVVALTNCPNLVCLPALDSLPRLFLLVLNLSIKELPQSFTHRGAFPALDSFNLEGSQLIEFPRVEEDAMPKLHRLNFDDCKFLHTLPASISLLTSIQTINLGSKNEKLMNFCKTNFRNSAIGKTFIVDGKPLIPEEQVFESVVPMEEDTSTVRGSEKRPFQNVHGDDEERLLKRGGLGSDFIMPSSPKRFVYLGSSSVAETTKSEKEHGLCEAL